MVERLPPSILLRTTLPRFALVGAVGFAVDAFILTISIVFLGWNAYGARVASFTAASAVTWHMNRYFTFRMGAHRDHPGKEYIRYAIVQVIGAAINMGVFMLAIWTWPGLRRWPAAPLALGAVAGLVWNYWLSKTWAFRR